MTTTEPRPETWVVPAPASGPPRVPAPRREDDAPAPSGQAVPAPGPTTRGARAAALARGCRPRQMTKNVLVLTAPAMAGAGLLEPVVLLGAAVAFVTFCAASAAVYLANDLRDVEADRRHPVKRFRPIASGAVTPGTAWRAAVSLVVGALALALLWSPALAVVLAGYLAVQVAYTGGLKNRPGVDLLVVASGFVLRVVAGGVAAGVELSVPFLTVVGFASLFMVAGKRYSELATLGSTGSTRPVLRGYSLRRLRATWQASAAVALGGYAVAAAGLGPLGTVAGTFALLSVPPFVAGIARYATHVRSAAAGCPEAVVFGDRTLQVLGLLWLVTVVPALAAA
ncbi:decaprenyl-phosphate phosphoribosyltransferase [Nocardioides xinjiangensis]|uniref:decaprenyl-phosphate phosphoribosyltransferase n=1 Tax=Nocardioides xinjiangensis TaxID=2817376 RepID=UPI001B30D508|nr:MULTISPECIES: decaprenyl-phosphate phosphoribosyltransferase [unclassified Nocardioides]